MRVCPYPSHLEDLINGRRVGIPESLLKPLNEPLPSHSGEVPLSELLTIPGHLGFESEDPWADLLCLGVQDVRDNGVLPQESLYILHVSGPWERQRQD